MNYNSDIDECNDNKDCKNGGTCVDGVGKYTCTCASGFTGSTCTDGLLKLKLMSYHLFVYNRILLRVIIIYIYIYK